MKEKCKKKCKLDFEFVRIVALNPLKICMHVIVIMYAFLSELSTKNKIFEI